MFSVNCPKCGQKVVEADDCKLMKAVCHKCKTAFEANVQEGNVQYKIKKQEDKIR